MPTPLPREEIESIKSQLDRDGYTILEGLIEPPVIEEVKEALGSLVDAHAANLLQAGGIEHSFEDAPFETRMLRLYENNLDVAPKSFRKELHLAGLFGLFFHPQLLDVVESLLGPEIRLYPNYTARPKFPEWEGTEVLWHQDGGYTANGSSREAVKTMEMINVWSPLVPVSRTNGCMEFVPGSHLQGVVPHQRKEHYLEIVPESLDPVRKDAVPIEVNPGDIVLFNNLLFHCGLPNKSDSIRWSLDWRYQNANEPTHRREQGHLARSQSKARQVVNSAEAWESFSFQ